MKRYNITWVKRILIFFVVFCLFSACRHTKKGADGKKSSPAHTTAAETRESPATRETAPETTARTTETTAGTTEKITGAAAETTEEGADADATTRAEATTVRKSLIDWDALFAQLRERIRSSRENQQGKSMKRKSGQTTAEAADKTEAKPADAPRQPQIPSAALPIYYEDAGLKITVTRQWYVGAWCYIAHVQMSDYSRLKTGMARDAYGYDELPASFAARHDCLLAVNGDYAEGDRKSVLRAGNIYGFRTGVVQAVYSQRTGEFASGNGATLSELVGMGYTDSFGFGASDLVVDSQSVYLRKDGGKSTQRTLIGTTGNPGDMYIVVTEGRYTDGVSRGLQYFEAGDLLQSLGCSYGVALDGGMCSAMVWDGRVLNQNPPQKTTGFVYITKR